MTVKELKEKLELLIEEDKGDYTVFVDNFINGCCDDVSIVVTDLFNEIVITIEDRGYIFE